MAPPSAQLAAYAGLLVCTFAWAAAFVAGKVVLQEMTPLSVAAWRYAAAAVVLFPFALRQRSRVGIVRAARPLAVMVLCGGVLYPWLFLQALVYTSATNTSLLITLNPVITHLLLSFAGERFDRRRLVGVLLALVGAVVVITRGDFSQLSRLSLNTGDLLAIVAATSWAGFNLASRRVVAELAPSLINCLVYGVGGVALYLLGRAQHPLAQLAGASPRALAGLALMAIFSSVVAGQLFLRGVRTVGVGRTVVFVYLVPVTTALLASTVLGERWVAAQAVGGATVLAGVFWTTRGNTRH